MIIKSLKLYNFQKHKKLDLKFTDGTNIVHGVTGSGKSCIRRAITWILFNSPKGDVVRKENTKKTYVIIQFDNGVEIEKIKSSSINRYILRKSGEEKVFDKVGSTIPEEIKNEINISPLDFDKESINLNVAEQLSLPFLLDKSGSTRCKLFNKLTGNDVLDKGFSNLNKDILGFGRKIKSTEEQIDENKKEHKKTEKIYYKKKKILSNFKSKLDAIKEKYVLFSTLNGIYEKYIKIIDDIEKNEKMTKNINVPEAIEFKELTEKIEKYENLKKLQKSLEKADFDIGHTQILLNKIKLKKGDFEQLLSKIEKFDKIKNLCYTLSDIEYKEEQFKNDLKDLDKVIILKEKEYKNFLEEIKYCPLCEQKINL